MSHFQIGRGRYRKGIYPVNSVDLELTIHITERVPVLFYWNKSTLNV